MPAAQFKSRVDALKRGTQGQLAARRLPAGVRKTDLYKGEAVNTSPKTQLRRTSLFLLPSHKSRQTAQCFFAQMMLYPLGILFGLADTQALEKRNHQLMAFGAARRQTATGRSQKDGSV